MDLFNLHTHSNFCDGKEPPENYVKKAIELDFHTLGFSSHAPVPFENHFSIKDDRLEVYFQTIRDLKLRYQDKTQILLSLEMDYIPGITQNFAELKHQGNLDYVIGGVHLIRNQDKEKLWFIDGPFPDKYDDGLITVFNGHARKGVKAYYSQIIEMIATQKPDIIAHLDKIKMHNKNRYFSEEEGWYKDLVWKTLNYISKETNCIVEVNTRGLYKKRCDTFFPGPDILEQIHHLNIPITLSSDAHKPEELNKYYGEALELLRDIGFKEILYYRGKERISQSI